MTNSESFQEQLRNKMGVLATMHRKEQVIAPILEHSLGIQVIVPEGLNTDAFGTFTRDIQRPGDQLQAARLKIAAAIELTGLTLALASEGSFGPHPSIPFLACDREIVMLSDRDQRLELVGQTLSTQTNYRSQQITTVEAALAFAEKVGFPTHGLIAMPTAQPALSDSIFKGITDSDQLLDIVGWLLKRYDQAHLETDMRAMYNPTRMNVIAQATHQLISQFEHCCAQCGTPGFSPVEYKPGLPCAVCKQPTELALAAIYHCKMCDFSQVIDYPDGNTIADPAQCWYCNP